MRDPYQVLGVAKSASEADIKKAFRSLAKKHHPDAHPGDEKAKASFQEISAAYDIVGDKDKRAQFDAGTIDEAGNPKGFGFSPGASGAGGQHAGFRPGGFGAGGFGGGGGGNARDFKFSWDNASGGTEGFSAEDIFADFLGGGRRGGARGRAHKGEDFSVSVTVSFAEGVAGGTRRVVLQNGEQIDVKIPAGVKDGQTIRVKGRGGAGRGGGANGDILIQVAVAPHPSIVRDGNDLRMDLPVTLQEAVLGGKVSVPTLSGTLSLSVPAGSNTGTVLRLKGKGIATATPGDLYVRLVVTLPDAPDTALQDFAKSWTMHYDPRTKMRG